MLWVQPCSAPWSNCIKPQADTSVQPCSRLVSLLTVPLASFLQRCSSSRSASSRCASGQHNSNALNFGAQFCSCSSSYPYSAEIIVFCSFASNYQHAQQHPPTALSCPPLLSSCAVTDSIESRGGAGRRASLAVVPAARLGHSRDVHVAHSQRAHLLCSTHTVGCV